MPLTVPAVSPRTIRFNSGTLRVIFLFGVLIICKLRITGSLCQYFRPSHIRAFAMFACVMGVRSSSSLVITGRLRILSVAGGFWPPGTAAETNPASRRAIDSLKWSFVRGIEVMPRRAFEAFFRWEHTCDRFVRDIFATESECGPSGRSNGEARFVQNGWMEIVMELDCES